ncbi:MAG: hypothetical protein KAQ62_12170, partial [Cyclobacteriaceae bacterium]|nr:hypothetical protein [Cyclobacteriaceae bacterium]
MKKGNAWGLSFAISTLMIGILIYLWIGMNEHEEVFAAKQNDSFAQSEQLVDENAVKRYFDQIWENQSTGNNVIKIKTGIFIQSLNFYNSSEVSVTGYIWQHYEDWQSTAIHLAPGEVGFILPDQVNTGSDIEPREVYRVRKGDDEVIGWYFEATLRQPFNYRDYPFDHKTVWIRMWPKDFLDNVVLVPDFDAYKSTGLTDIFGIEKSIVLGTWERMNTYFNYNLSSYDTNFGLDDSSWQQAYPELHYNFVIKRKFENAFIVYLLPLFLVASLLFAALLTVSGNDKISTRLGFSTSGFIGASSALFFVIMIAHIQLRRQFSGASIVY